MTAVVAPLLHAGAPVGPIGFDIEWSTVIGLVLFGALYEWRARQGRRVSGDRPTVANRIWFYGGVVVMFLTLNGPMDTLSDHYLFSVHMLQHLMLTLVIPPLFIAGTPGWMLRPLLRSPRLAALLRVLTRPGLCLTVFGVVLGVWHLPPLYDAAIRNEHIHIMEHLMFLAAAVMMWWPVMSPLPELPRLSYPRQILHLFLVSLEMTVLAIWITLAHSVLYAPYAAFPRIWALTPLQDQRIGGMVMWIPGAFSLYAAISVVFFKWQQRDGDESEAGAQAGWIPGPAK